MKIIRVKLMGLNAEGENLVRVRCVAPQEDGTIGDLVLRVDNPALAKLKLHGVYDLALIPMSSPEVPPTQREAPLLEEATVEVTGNLSGSA